jgi:hypothetical protein
MIPIYGFVEGDTIGMLMLALPEETVRAVAERLQQSASLRVAPREIFRIVYRGRTLDLDLTVRAAGFEALDRLDLVGRGTGEHP